MTANSRKPLVLVDGSSYLYRAFHALPPLTNAAGEPTGAIYGVVNMLKKLLSDYQPDHMAVVFDAKGKTFRSDRYELYKATRPPMPDELGAQIEPLHAIIEAMGLPLLCIDGVEADDVIGSLARAAQAGDMHVVVSTSDKDLAQIVSAQVTLVNTMSGRCLDVAGVAERFGVPPERMVDYLALVGDTVDNIPGVPGVGPKTAAKWLQAYASMTGVIEHAGEIKGKIGEKLRAALADLPLSYELATIKCDVPLALAPRDLGIKPPDTERLRALYQRYQFKAWLAALDKNQDAETPIEAPSPVADQRDQPRAEEPRADEPGDYETILTDAQLTAWLDKLAAAELVAFDTETDDLNYARARVVGMSFAVRPGQAAYLPLAHDYPGAPSQLDFDLTLARLKPWLEDASKLKVGHHLKYDRNVLSNHGVTLAGIAHDTMLESYVLNSTATRHDLDTLCERHLRHTNIHFEDVAGKGVKQLTFNQVALEEAAPYAAEDADMTLRLHRHFWPQIEAMGRLRTLYQDIEMPLVPVLSRMECGGVLIDAVQLAAQSSELATRMAEAERAAFEAAGQPFNIGSPKQIQEILYDKQGLPVRRKTPKGQPSTAEDVLAELALDYPLPRLIIDHRGLSKLKSTYTDKLPRQVNGRTGRVHTSYHQAVASTGRLSSSEPNLQNIPIRTVVGRRIRQAFIAPPGYAILAADYSQIELRIMAHLSGDAGLRTAFDEDKDIHRATAAEVFAVHPELVSNDQRRAAKAINFGLIYGMSAFGLARQLGIDRGAAQDYVNRYFDRYPGVKAYMDATREQARERGYVETVYGRRLYLPEIKSRNAPRRQYAERTAINAPMQGTAADIIKRAMIAVDAWLQDVRPSARMVMQVHDELVFEVATDAAPAVMAEIVPRMTAAAELTVTLKVEAALGANWDEAH
ncbi:MAG: DNA polymerase I [Gammaproteobacteria bacterium]|nr:DNA polymerase I [Gammaproteobacteria bacterium]